MSNLFPLIPTALAESAEAEPQPTWFQTAIEDVLEQPWYFWLVAGVLLAVGVIVFAMTRNKAKTRTFWTARTMSVGAMCIALASVLSLIKLIDMPTGGCITPASMLPLLFFAYAYGAGPGITLCVLYGLMQWMLGGFDLYYGVVATLVDYPIAFGALGLAGLMHHDKTHRGMAIGIIIGCAGRFFFSFLSGWIFYGQWAWAGWNPAAYSFCYNGAYMLPECIICIVLGLIIGDRLMKELNRFK